MATSIVRTALLALSLCTTAAAAKAQEIRVPPHEQSPEEALAQDAAEYARFQNVDLATAKARLIAQEASVAATDRIGTLYKDRLAGISIEHQPDYRIVVLLTGTDAVADEVIEAGGLQVPIVYRTGAAATQDRLVAAIRDNQAKLRAALPSPPGLGVDPRSGELVLLVRSGDADLYGRSVIETEVEAALGLPVRVGLLDQRDDDFAVEGGARVDGIEASTGRRLICTTGFVVTDERRTGVVTAAHCPDTLTYRDPEGGTVELAFGGQWGAQTQDVQLHVSDRAQRPVFYVDDAKTKLRSVRSERSRPRTRAGDFVCHIGERTGYSCAIVGMVDYAPPGDLCGGHCEPVWVTVAGPTCRSGDSGGPVFAGNIAFGIVKGGNYRPDGGCNFYYYMSTDYLPAGWRLLREAEAIARAASTEPR